MNFIEKTGIVILLINLLLVLIYYYGAVKIYNLEEKKKYRCMGYLWISRKKGEYCLKIPVHILEKSVTTKYRLVPEEVFVYRNRGRRLRVIFEGGSTTAVDIAEDMVVKNHIATSNQL